MKRVHRFVVRKEAGDEWALRRKALSDPVRVRIFERLNSGPATAKQLAEAVRMEPNRLYYHLRLLLQADLIEETGREVSGRMVERVFGLTGRGVSSELGAGDPVERAAFFGALLDTTRTELQDLMFRGQRAQRRVRVLRSAFKLSPEEFDEMAAELDRTIQRISEREPSGRDIEFRMTLVIYEAGDSDGEEGEVDA